METSEAATAVAGQRQLGPASSASRRGSEYAQLSRQIKEAGLLERRGGYYAWKIAATAVALAAGWAVFVMVGNSWWQLAVAAFLAVVFTQIGFLGHDAGHRQIFGSRRASYVAGILLGNLGIGLSYGWWVSKHNRHHAHPNTEGADPDIAVSALAFTAAQARASRGAARLVFRYQAYLFFPLLLGEAVSPWRRLPHCRAAGALTGQGRSVHPGAAGPVRPVPGVLLRPQPQRHAHPGRH
jgi:fatty acid desaturase